MSLASPPPQSQAERAAKEALESFGGSDFASIPVRRIDLRSQLKREAEKQKKGEEKEQTDDGGEPPRKRPRTRYVRK